MPPDIMVNLASLPAPAGTTPSKTATGPPGTDALSTLFATLLAQSSATRGVLPKANAASGGTLNPDSQSANSKKATGNSKTMDTAPVRASLPPEKKSTTGGELLLQKAQADVPAASPPLPTLSSVPLSSVLLSSVVVPMPAVLGPVLATPVLAAVTPVAVTKAASTGAKAPAGVQTASQTLLLLPAAATEPKTAEPKTAEPKTLAPVPSAALGFPIVALSASIPEERVVSAQGVILPRTFVISQVISQSPSAATQVPSLPSALTNLAVPAAATALTAQGGPAASPGPASIEPGVLAVPTALNVQAAVITVKAAPALLMVPAAAVAVKAAPVTPVLPKAPVTSAVSNVQALPNVQAAATAAKVVTNKPATEANPVSSGENAMLKGVGSVVPTTASTKPIPNAAMPQTVPASHVSPAAALPTPLPTTAGNILSVSTNPVTATAATANVVSEAALLNVSGSTAEKELPGSPQNTLKSAAPSADTETVKSTGSSIAGAKATVAKPPATDALLSVTAKSSSTLKENGPKSDPNAALTGTVATTITAEAAKTETPTLTATDRTAIVRQVADSVGTMPLPRTPGTTEQMTLQLHPKDWGKLHVSVTLTPGPDAGSARTVTAHIVADTPQVKAALESGKGELHQTLREAGLHLEHLTVSVKPAEVKPASEGAASGMPFDQSRQGAGNGFSQGSGQGSTGSGASGQAPNSSGSASSGTPSFASFSGDFQGGQQGQPTTSYAGTSYRDEPEPDIAPLWSSPVRLATGRIDLHA